MFGFNKQEIKILIRLNTPAKIQDFLNKLKINFEPNGDTFMSPRKVLETKKAHCIEGAAFAAVALRFHGYEPLVVDMTASKNDFDHVIAVFRENNKWGAITKTNHAVLRYREPVYKTIRELVMSFFHEYFDDNGKKTLRSFTKPVNLKRFDKYNWMTSDEDLWYIDDYLTNIKHFPILNKKQIKGLRKADDIEIQAGKLVEFKDPVKRKI